MLNDPDIQQSLYICSSILYMNEILLKKEIYKNVNNGYLLVMVLHNVRFIFNFSILGMLYNLN